MAPPDPVSRCHAGGDLVFQNVVDDSVIFVRAGSHAERFE
jgi:mRNA-degrading endonuclease YafQ of YafQ-DinJ toxin-antitoxin module